MSDDRAGAYFVHRVSNHPLRAELILRVSSIEGGAYDGGGLIAEGEPSRRLRITRAESVFDESNRLLVDADGNRVLLLIADPPDFPAEELTGKRLVGAVPRPTHPLLTPAERELAEAAFVEHERNRLDIPSRRIWLVKCDCCGQPIKYMRIFGSGWLFKCECGKFHGVRPEPISNCKP